MTAVEGESKCDVVVVDVWRFYIPKVAQRMSQSEIPAPFGAE
jgi:hypothetical protein